ncbi:YhcN/YlaJ family sporulation lipoprotein [Lentibacillus sediminis]|uniref:YhcN/YlaJ family sporulation lipoprotein n=1 Tax=Lentibacillus sediminis TaxID=1940529 RepID=UPI000C1B8426|nr:YhcN/YlaJ family sporulation lipoprotein [Lentibacillus sediminis]
MKWKLLSIVMVLAFVLAACGNGGNDQNEGAADNPNVEPQNFNNNNGPDMGGERDYDMRRGSEEGQDRNNNNNNGANNNDANRYEVAEEAADQISEQVDEIDNAYVLTTGNNAYVAAGFDANGNNNNNNRNMNTGNQNNNTGNQNQDNEEQELTDEVRQEITEIVKSVDNNIENVYISTNPDFVDLTNNYVDDVDNGEPVEGFFDQFGNMVDRIFPGDGNNGNN